MVDVVIELPEPDARDRLEHVERDRVFLVETAAVDFLGIVEEAAQRGALLGTAEVRGVGQPVVVALVAQNRRVDRAA